MNVFVEMFVAFTLFSTMLALGLSLRTEALRHWTIRSSLALRVALGSCLLIPLLGVALLYGPWSAQISMPMRITIALMALCPSAPLAVRKVRRQGGDHALAAVVQVQAAMMAMVTIPLLSPFFPHAFDRGGWLNDQIAVSLSAGWDVALQVGRVQVLPLLVGLGLRHLRPRLAERMEAPLNKIANLLLLILFAVILFTASGFLLRFIAGNLAGLLLMALQVSACLLIGRWLAAGDQRAHGNTTSLVTAMRNPGLALLFASHFGDEVYGLKLAILLYALMTALISIPVLRFNPSRPRQG